MLHGDGRPLKSALVLGGASSVFDDAKRALQLGAYDITIACNAIGTAWQGPIDIWCSLHPDRLSNWRLARANAGRMSASRHIAHKEGYDIEGREYRFDGHPSGSSGLFAVKIAMEEGCDRIVLAGVPMEVEAAHFNSAKTWTDCSDFLPAWEQALPLIKDVTTSMSGWTAERLGMPTAAWLQGDD